VSERLRVTFTVEYDVLGDLPPASCEPFAQFLVESLLAEAPGLVHLYWGDFDEAEDFQLEPVGWGVDAGEYGDLSTGLTL
jgi:hypothetical protein